MDVAETSSQQDLSRLKFKLLPKHLFKSRVISIGLIFIFTCLLCTLGIEIYLRFFLENQQRVVPLEDFSSSFITTTYTIGVPDQNIRTIRKRYLKKITKKPSKSVSTSTEDINIIDTSVNSGIDTTSSTDPVIVLEKPDITTVDVSAQIESIDLTPPPPPSTLNSSEQLAVIDDSGTSTQTNTTQEQTTIAQPVKHTPLPSSVMETVPAPVAGIPTQAAILYYEEGEEADSEMEEQSEPAVRAKRRGGAPAVVVPVAAPPLPNQANEQELQRLQQELDAKDAENVQLEQARIADQQKFRRDLAIRRGLITRLQTIYDDNILVNGLLEQARAVDQQEILRLQQELAAKNKESDQLRQDRETVQQENVPNELWRLQQAGDAPQLEITDLHSELEMLRSERDSLRLERDSAQQELTKLQQKFALQGQQLYLQIDMIIKSGQYKLLTELNVILRGQIDQLMDKVALGQQREMQQLGQQGEIQLSCQSIRYICYTHPQIDHPPGGNVLFDPVTSIQPTIFEIKELLSSDLPLDLTDLVKLMKGAGASCIIILSNRFSRACGLGSKNQGAKNQRLFSITLIGPTFSPHYQPENIRTDLRDWLDDINRNSHKLQLKHFVKCSVARKTTACQVIQDHGQITPTVLQSENIEISVADI